VVRGVEAEGGDVAEGPDGLAVVAGAERVAGVLDEPEIVLLGDRRDRLEVERMPSVWASMMARVFGVTASATRSASAL